MRRSGLAAVVVFQDDLASLVQGGGLGDFEGSRCHNRQLGLIFLRGDRLRLLESVGFRDLGIGGHNKRNLHHRPHHAAPDLWGGPEQRTAHQLPGNGWAP